MNNTLLTESLKQTITSIVANKEAIHQMEQNVKELELYLNKCGINIQFRYVLPVEYKDKELSIEFKTSSLDSSYDLRFYCDHYSSTLEEYVLPLRIIFYQHLPHFIQALNEELLKASKISHEKIKLSVSTTCKECGSTLTTTTQCNMPQK